MDYTAPAYPKGAFLDFDHGMLYVTTTTTTGFSVSSDVNVVLCLANKDHDPFDDVDDSYTGYDGLEKALRNLDADNGNLVGQMSVIFENGRATTIILNDLTGPKSNRNDAEAPDVEIIPDPANIVVGDSLTLTANVKNADECGKLTYQWYVDKGDGNGYKTIAGATSASYNVGTVTAAMKANYSYKCVVTNTDERNVITGDTVVTGNETFSLATYVADASMNIWTTYTIQGTNTVVKTVEDDSVKDTDNDGFITVTADVDGNNQFVVGTKTYEVVGVTSKKVEFKANTTQTVDFAVVEVVEEVTTMDVQIKYMLNTTKVSSEIAKLSVADGTSYVVAAEEGKTIVVGDVVYTVTETTVTNFVPGGFDTVEVPVDVAGYLESSITVPAALTVEWAAEAEADDGTAYIAVGTSGTASLADGIAKYDENGDAYVPATVELGDDGDVDNLPADTAYGYAKVTVVEEVTGDSALDTHTITATIAGGKTGVKMGAAGSVTVSIADDTAIGTPRTVNVAASDGSTIGTISPATVTFSGGDSKNVTIQVTPATDEIVLTITLSK